MTLFYIIPVLSWCSADCAMGNIFGKAAECHFGRAKMTRRVAQEIGPLKNGYAKGTQSPR